MTVSIVTMKGEECQVMKLGDMAKVTGGKVSPFILVVIINICL